MKCVKDEVYMPRWIDAPGFLVKSRLPFAGAGRLAGGAGSPNIGRLIFTRPAERAGLAIIVGERVALIPLVRVTKDQFSERR